MTTLTAGREMDALIAEKVMGWTDCRLDTREDDEQARWFVPTGIAQDGRVAVLPYFSVDIAAAWLVIEAMADRGWSVDVQNRYRPTWAVHVWRPDSKHRVYEHHKTAPLAICRAALAAVEDQ